VHGYPWNHSLFPLSGNGYSYTENEYFFSGTATNLEKGVSAPYTSRMLVRLPTDPAKFNGTVIVEWVNVTAKGHRDAVADRGRIPHEHGYGYVVVDAQLLGVCCGPMSLKTWDPDRYAALAHRVMNSPSTSSRRRPGYAPSSETSRRSSGEFRPSIRCAAWRSSTGRGRRLAVCERAHEIHQWRLQPR